jgi:hypothetical protein
MGHYQLSLFSWVLSPLSHVLELTPSLTFTRRLGELQGQRGVPLPCPRPSPRPRPSRVQHRACGPFPHAQTPPVIHCLLKARPVRTQRYLSPSHLPCHAEHLLWVVGMSRQHANSACASGSGRGGHSPPNSAQGLASNSSRHACPWCLRFVDVLLRPLGYCCSQWTRG